MKCIDFTAVKIPFWTQENRKIEGRTTFFAE